MCTFCLDLLPEERPEEPALPRCWSAIFSMPVLEGGVELLLDALMLSSGPRYVERCEE